ncbi:MAG TPA: hypothetical protein VL098_07385 [Flavipsychrobacter sp.]|nr:hypothetical protein [Flavipsychrobacter sp.]
MNTATSPKEEVKPFGITTKLTAIWAISESGLGGFMHAAKIPFTGFFLGGFSIIIISLIAHYNSKKWNSITAATLLVILIKAVASPHSPPAAYLAVAFQGLSGACVYALFSVNRLSAATFGMIALAESAVQKLIVMTLIFGKNIWDALDAFFRGLTTELHLHTSTSFSFWIIGIYTGIYMVWGAVVGWWATALPGSLSKRSAEIVSRFQSMQSANTTVPTSKTKSRKLLLLFAALVFIVSVFAFQGSFGKASNVVFRTIAAMLLLYYIAGPFITWVIQAWARKQRAKNSPQVKELMDLLPEIKSYVKPALQIAKADHKDISVYPAFVINWIVLSLYHRS